MTAEAPLVRSASKDPTEKDKDKERDTYNTNNINNNNFNSNTLNSNPTSTCTTTTTTSTTSTNNNNVNNNNNNNSLTKENRDSREKDKLADQKSDSPRLERERDREREGQGTPEVTGGDEDEIEAAEVIVKVLWGEFKARSKRKIDEVMAFGIDDKFQLSDVFAMKVDPGYHHMIDSLGELAFHALNVLSSALLQWKASQHTSPASLRAKIEDSASKTSVKEGMLNMLEERHQLAVDYIFCTTFLVVLNALTRKGLEDDVAAQIEQCCFEFFKMERRQYQQYIIINASWIPDLYAFILSALSTIRLKSIAARFFKELSAPVSSGSARARAISILQGIRYLRLKISSKRSLQDSNEVLLNFIDILKQTKIAKGEVRRALFESLATMLKPVSEQEFEHDLNYMDWYTSIRDLWERVSRKTKKTKDIVITYPLMALLLAASNNEFFKSNFGGFLETLLKVKDKAVRPFALEALRYLLTAYLAKKIEGQDEVYERLQTVVGFVFPLGSSKRLTGSEKEPLDIFVDIITCIASYRIDFAVQNIIFELLKTETREILAPERMIVALRAVLIIHTPSDTSSTHTLATAPAAAGTAPFPLSSSSSTPSSSSSSSTSTSTLSSFIIPDLTFKSRGATRIFTLTSGSTSSSGNSSLRMVSSNTPTKSRRRFESSSLEPYYKNLGAFLSQILLSLDAAFGGHLFTQSKPLAELLEKSKTPGVLGLELLKLAITCIPISFPAKIPVAELVTMLAKFLIHLDKGIHDKATAILSQLMASRADLRAHLVYGLGKFALSIPDTKHPLIQVVLVKESQLLKQWVSIIKHPRSRSRPPSRDSIRSSVTDSTQSLPPIAPGSLDGTDDFDPALVEAVGLVFLCSPYPKIRQICVEMLSSVRLIYATAIEAERTSYEELIPTRLMDIIDETGPDIMSRIQHPISSLMDDKHRVGHKINEKTIDRIVAGETKDDQFGWTFCLAELAKVAVELVPEVVAFSWPIIASRIPRVQPEESSTNPEQETLVVWWRNYIVLACAIVPQETASRPGSPNNFQTVKHNTHSLISNMSYADLENVPTGPRDLFEKILPYLKSSDSCKEAAIMALERTNLVCLPILFEILRAQETELLNLKKGRKKNDKLRNILGLIRRYIVETMKQGTLVDNDILRRSYLEYIQEQLVFFRQCHEESIGNDFLWDNLQFARYNFCILIRHVAVDLHLARSHEFFERGLRKEIFKLLSKWCEGETLLKEEQTKKKLNGFLAQVRDFSKRAEYEKMINEHTVVLQYATAMAISSLFLGTSIAEPPSAKDLDGVAFSWINKMMLRTDKLRLYARVALENLLKGNVNNTDMILYAINQCYSDESQIARGYFLGLVELFKDHDPVFPNSSSIILNLIIYKAGDANASVRQSAIQLLHLFQVQTMYEPPHVASYPSSIGSSVHETYHFSQLQLSERLARDYPDLAYGIFTETIYRLEKAPTSAQRDRSPPTLQKHTPTLAQKQMLQCMVPWVETMDFAKLARSALSTQEAVIQSFLLATLRHVENHPDLVRKIWTSVAKRGRDNIRFVFEHLMLLAVKKQNPEFVALSKIIAIYLGRCAPATVVDLLVTELSPISSQTTSSITGGSTTPPPQKLLSPHSNHTHSPNHSTDVNNNNNNASSGERGNSGVVSGNTSSGERFSNNPNAPSPTPNPNTSSGGNRANTNSSSGNRDASASGNSGLTPTAALDGDFRGAPYTDYSSSSWSGISLSQLFPSAVGHVRSAFSAAMPEFIDTPALASMHIVLILLSEIAFEIGDHFRKHLHVILQLVFLGFDHHHAPVYEHCRVLLLNLVHSLVIKKHQSMDRDPAESPEFDEALQLFEFIQAKEGKQFWPMEDVTMRKTEIPSSQDLSSFVNRVVSVLAEEGGDLSEKWATEALVWATRCPVHHWAARSYQIYRTLKAAMTLDAVSDIFHSLGVCLANPTPENLGLTIEILHTLQVMVEWVPTSKLILFPQLFWGTVALLHSDYEIHFAQSVKLLSKLVDRFNFSDRAVHNIFLASIPKSWTVPFVGVQPLVIRGLLSPIAEPDTIDILSKITLTPFGEIFQADETRFFTNIAAQLPWLVSHCAIATTSQDKDKDERSHLCVTAAERISAACKHHGFHKLGKVFKKYGKGHFENPTTFLEDLRIPLVDRIRANDAYRILSLLFRVLDQGQTYSQQSTLQILYILLTGVDLTTPSIRSHLPSWISIVARFVTGPIWKDASRALEAIVNSFPPAQMDVTRVVRSQPQPHIPAKPGFANKPGQGVDHTLTELMKVLATCMGTGSAANKAKKSPSATYEVFEKFFAFHDVVAAGSSTAASGSDLGSISRSASIRDMHAREGKEKSDVKSSPMFGGPLLFGGRKHSIDEGDQESGQDLQDLGSRAKFYSFPSFHGFDDLMEGLEAQREMMDEESGMNFNSGSLSSHHSFKSSRESPMMGSLPSRRLTKSGEYPTLTPHILSSSGTPLHSIKEIASSSSSPSLALAPSSASTLSSTSSSTLLANMHNTSLAALIRASRSRWMQCAHSSNLSNPSNFENPTERVCAIFVAASQLVHQLTLEFRTLHRQYLNILSDSIVLVLDSPVLRSDIFDTGLFRPVLHDTVGNLATIAAARFSDLVEDPTYARSYNEQKERCVSIFTEQLNMYTEQKSVVATARAKLLENEDEHANEDSPAHQGLREVRLGLSVASLHYQLLLLWLANASLQSLLIDLISLDESLEDKQRNMIEQELQKNQNIVHTLKEKEGLYINLMRKSRHLFFVDRDSGKGSGGDSDREYKEKDHKKKR